MTDGRARGAAGLDGGAAAVAGDRAAPPGRRVPAGEPLLRGVAPRKKPKGGRERLLG